MIGNSARPGGSLGEMLHQLREQAEGAASRFLLQVLAAAIGTNLPTRHVCYTTAFGGNLDVEPTSAKGRV
jgi:hypothetical protein